MKRLGRTAPAGGGHQPPGATRGPPHIGWTTSSMNGVIGALWKGINIGEDRKEESVRFGRHLMTSPALLPGDTWPRCPYYLRPGITIPREYADSATGQGCPCCYMVRHERKSRDTGSKRNKRARFPSTHTNSSFTGHPIVIPPETKHLTALTVVKCCPILERLKPCKRMIVTAFSSANVWLRIAHVCQHHASLRAAVVRSLHDQ